MPANHYSGSLSETDLAIVHAVPPGGNWKNVPNSIECKRIQTIRESFARGEGSRSTYYGRLHPDAPSYTINTYFSRPGNGCHIHYEQDRVLSQREAARLQSFPDSFEFVGRSKTAINRQIGNAVAPLVGYQVARSLGEPGVFIDLFAGAGGLSLGFIWAGWRPLAGNDIDAPALATYAANVHPDPVLGDIRDPAVADALVKRASDGRRTAGDVRCLILGGPPCQGFSTAGKRRTMDDDRNQLFWQYKAMVDRIRPDGFVFENVTGLLNMERGRVFRDVSAVLGEGMDDMRADVLRAERYGVPQRRWRVFVVASRAGAVPPPPPIVSDFPAASATSSGVTTAPSVREALQDLPPLRPREDASHEPLGPATTSYQAFCRGELSPSDYVDELLALRSHAPPTQLAIGV